MKDVTKNITMPLGHGSYGHVIGEESGETFSIDGGRWEVEIDTFLDKSQFPSSYYGEVCDISIKTGSVSIDFFMAIGNIIKFNEAINIIVDLINKKKYASNRLVLDEKSFSISNITINGKWYSVGDLTIVPRTPFKSYVSFTEKDDNETDIDDEETLSYDLVCKYQDLKDITDRIIRNYKSLKKIMELD